MFLIRTKIPGRENKSWPKIKLVPCYSSFRSPKLLKKVWWKSFCCWSVFPKEWKLENLVVFVQTSNRPLSIHGSREETHGMTY